MDAHSSACINRGWCDLVGRGPTTADGQVASQRKRRTSTRSRRGDLDSVLSFPLCGRFHWFAYLFTDVATLPKKWVIKLYRNAFHAFGERDACGREVREYTTTSFSFGTTHRHNSSQNDLHNSLPCFHDVDSWVRYQSTEQGYLRCGRSNFLCHFVEGIDYYYTHARATPIRTLISGPGKCEPSLLRT